MQIETEFDFEAAHRLVGYKGKCSNLHGHQWKVKLSITGKTLDNIGMLWDFTNIKNIKELFDHKTLLKACPENYLISDALIRICGKDSVVFLSENPTAEYIATRIRNFLMREKQIDSATIIVYENNKSCATVGFVK